MVGASFAGPGGAHTNEVVEMTKSQSGDTRWIVSWGVILTLVAVVIPLGAGSLFGYSDKMLVYAGAVVTALVALIAHTLTRQSNRRLAVEQKQSFGQLKLEAAMRAGQLVSSKDGLGVDRAAAASSLLALTRLDQAGLAVAMLVDLWDGGKDKVSTETAILVIDGALRSDQRNAQLMAAELLCRNARSLDACQSLHWPSVIDGGWDPRFGDKTKLLLFEALLDMTLTKAPNENALRSVAVRLYGVWAAEAAERRRSGRIPVTGGRPVRRSAATMTSKAHLTAATEIAEAGRRRSSAGCPGRRCGPTASPSTGPVQAGRTSYSAHGCRTRHAGFCGLDQHNFQDVGAFQPR
ncbi:hypothetical protein [Paractinoplanes durhamensis]|uniref:Uncharacterized protein n=1 Tax=Paractinoplanes durhamensis TaxID=113563 RepID=A0ABQ3YWG2_9ACTN|nr:hypothetical protein [Actinoplanes durhamensis]GIE01932.1 hypothetical protein Adu01nite_32820 [Actinoplanes durhamensis]